MALEWGKGKVDTSNLSGYAKQWADAYNSQVDSGVASPSDTLNHAYATSTAYDDDDDRERDIQSIVNDFSNMGINRGDVKVIDWVDAFKKELYGQQQTTPAPGVPPNGRVPGGYNTYLQPGQIPQGPPVDPVAIVEGMKQNSGGGGSNKVMDLVITGGAILVLVKVITSIFGGGKK